MPDVLDLWKDSSEGTSANQKSVKSSSGEPPHVCVVGAGASGLRCAEVLINHGVRVTILEARDRIGGRICQTDRLGYTVDLGPQWIHTSGTNPILDLAAKSGTELHSWNDRMNLYDSDGMFVDEDKAVQLSDLRWSLIDDAIKYSAANMDKISKDESLYDFIEKKAKEEHGTNENGNLDETLLLAMAKMWGCYTGHGVDRQSLRFAWMEECCGGEELIVTSTYSKILSEIARTALASADIQLNTKVTSIDSTTFSAERKVHLRTSANTQLSFDSVILTTPLGWLKQNLKSFTPRLPSRLISAISSISVGHLEKVFVTFPTAWWAGPSSADNPHPTSTFPSYTNWLAPNYAKDTNPCLVPQECWNLAAFPPPHSHPTLLFYTYAPLSLHIASLTRTFPPDCTPNTPLYYFLWSFFKPYISLLPHFSLSDPACLPTAILATAWAEDELAGYGSYCNFQVGVEDASGDVEALRTGVPDGGLWFAGEHVAPFEECGTVAGAYLSGEGAARRVLGSLGVGSVDSGPGEMEVESRIGDLVEGKMRGGK